MDPINIEPQKDTPKVTLDKENNIFELSGKSLPENVVEFYKPVLEWLDTYSNSPNPKTKFEMKFLYFNTASSKLILDILFKLADMHENGTEVLVSWYYKENNEEMKEAGEEYADIVEIPFEFISFK